MQKRIIDVAASDVIYTDAHRGGIAITQTIDAGEQLVLLHADDTPRGYSSIAVDKECAGAEASYSSSAHCMSPVTVVATSAAALRKFATAERKRLASLIGKSVPATDVFDDDDRQAWKSIADAERSRMSDILGRIVKDC